MTQPQSQSQPQSPQPVFTTLQNAILAAASGDRTSIFHLVVAVFTSARATVRCLAEHYKTHHHLLTTDILARLKYCAARLEAIFYTIRHAPERFFSAAQLRALTRARAVLAHIWNQPVDFDPLISWLTSPANCPPPPHSAASAPISASSPASPDDSLRAPRSTLHTSSADPRLLLNPGRALASVLLQLAAIYGLSASPRLPLSASSSAAPSAPSAPSVTPHPEIQPIASNSTPNPPASTSPANSISPRSELRAPHFSSPIHTPP